MKDLVIVRGAGDLATGVLCRLFNCGFPVLALESDRPSAIRRTVSFSEAVYNGTAEVEGVTARKVSRLEQIESTIAAGRIPLLIDPCAASVNYLKPIAVVDAIIAKKNLGTNRDMAPVTIAMGPGFRAGTDVDAVIETMRGHNLARIIYEGSAAANTGVPGKIAGYDKERVIHAPCAGMIRDTAEIGTIVEKGEVIAFIDNEPIYATVSGVLRGMIRNGFRVREHFKIADIDPRIEERDNCFTISDKSRALSGSVLEALLVLRGKNL